MSSETAPQRREVRYYGRVQGVGFRYTTARLAAHLPVVGFVRNLPDGTVELVAEGQSPDLERLLGAIDDEMGRHIRSTEVSTPPPTHEFTRFEIRH